MITNNGDNEFKLPARALSIFVSAMQNKIEGMKLPRKPVNIIYHTISLGSTFNAQGKKG